MEVAGGKTEGRKREMAGTRVKVESKFRSLLNECIENRFEGKSYKLKGCVN